MRKKGAPSIMAPMAMATSPQMISVIPKPPVQCDKADEALDIRPDEVGFEAHIGVEAVLRKERS